MSVKVLNLSDIIKNQAIINVGCIGHVSNGKSTLVRQMTGIKTQKFRSEQEKNITINLGYANCKIFYSDETQEYKYCSSRVENVKDSAGNEMSLIHHISFVDCPGHESYMSNMLSGTSVIDMAFLVEAANAKEVPQPQTMEHLVAIQNTNIEDIVIIQNKCDLVDRESLITNKNQIDIFIDDFLDKEIPVIPLIAQTGSNTEYVGKYLANNLTDYDKDINQNLQINIIRTFDINKPKESVSSMNGGVLGGTIVSGILRVGDIVQISPGVCNKQSDGGWVVNPLYTTVNSIHSEKSKMEYAIPGGLLGIGTDIDPSFCKSNNLVGQIVTHPNENLDIAYEIELDYKVFRRIDKEHRKISVGEILKLGILAKNVQGVVAKSNKKRIWIKLGLPVCINNQSISIMKKINESYKLFGIGSITNSKNAEVVQVYDNVEKPEYKIVNDLKRDDIECFNYEEMIDSLNHTSVKKEVLRMPKPMICKSSNRLQQIIMNYSDIMKSQVNARDDMEFKPLFEKSFSERLICQVSVNGAGQLIVNDRKSDKHKVERILISTIVKYRKCIVCGGYKTFLTKEDRLIKINCEMCQSASTVN